MGCEREEVMGTRKSQFLKSLPITLLTGLLLGSYAWATFYGWYHVSLEKVERSTGTKRSSTEQKTGTILDMGSSGFHYEDDLIQTIWQFDKKRINFVLNNKTNSTMKIIWDGTSFVDMAGLGHRVMHGGVKYTDRSNPQPPTVILRKGSVEDMMLPTDHVRFQERSYSPSEWVESPLLPEFEAQTRDELNFKAAPYLGKTMQVLLPLEIDGIVNEYILTFKIKEVYVSDTSQITKIRPREWFILESFSSIKVGNTSKEAVLQKYGRPAEQDED
jgi:hypothetical protein